MRQRITKLGTTSLTLFLLISVKVSAQQVSSFEQLQLLVKPGDKIEVTLAPTLQNTSGRIIDLTPATLRIKTGGVERAFSQRDVLEIKQRRPDSLANGAKWGALVGGGGTALLFALGCSISGCPREDIPFLLVGIAVDTGIGAGVGIGIDAMVEHKQSIYRTPNRPVSGLHVTPMLTSRRKGATLSMTF